MRARERSEKRGKIKISLKIINFDNWKQYDGFAEGSGRSEKVWLQSDDGNIGLFKYPKVDSKTNETTTEHVSEHMAHVIGNVLEIETAKVDLGTYHGRVGSMSYLINKPDEFIAEGALYISGLHPDYNLDEMREINSGRYYCFDHLLEVSNNQDIVNSWIKMVLFDYIIGNSDRHQNNWALIIDISVDPTKSESVRACPLYDNGSSLCCYVTDQKAKEYLGKDKTRFTSLTDTKSRSMIRIDGYKKKRPTHIEVVKYLLAKYPSTNIYARDYIEKLNLSTIDEIVSNYKGVLSDVKIELIDRFLKRKIEILEKLVDEVEHDT